MQLENQFQYTLDGANPESLDLQIASLTDQLEIAIRARNALTHMNKEMKEKALSESKKAVEELQEKIKTQSKIHQNDLQNLQKDYMAYTRELTEVLKPLIRESGTAQFKNLKRNSFAANYSMAQVYAGFYDAEKNYINVNIRFIGQGELPEKPEMLAGKFPIIRKSDRSLLFKIGKTDVNIYGSPKKWTSEQLKAAALEFVRCDEILKLQEK